MKTLKELSTSEEESLKEYLYSKDDSVRRTTMLGMAIGLVKSGSTDIVAIKSTVDQLATRYLVDSTYLEAEARKYLDYANSLHATTGYLRSFSDLLGFGAFYTPESIENVDKNLPALRAGYNAVRG